MADQASSTIHIAAPPAAVMAVIADLEAYPEWSTAIKSVVVEEMGGDSRATSATFTLDAGVVKDTYTLAYDWDGDRSVAWHLVKGQALKAQDGRYQLAAAGDGTDVTYELSVELSIPMLGMFKRKAEKVIIDTALKGLKRRAEAGGGSSG